MITLYSKDGQVKVEKIKKFSYSGKFMGECFLTANFASSDILNFDIGDYVMFRGEKFVLNYIPAKKKQASKGVYGKAFEYDSVKFNSLADELTRIEFIDVVKYDNNITYSSQPTFSFYAGNIHDLVDRIQTNLDLEFKGDERWAIVVSEDVVSTSKNISVSNISIWDAVALINTEFGLNFTFKNRTITIGESGLAVGKVFTYGKDNGLFDIQQTTNQDAKIITRLRAFGSIRNIPIRYYNNLKDEQGKPYVLESDDIKNLMLPSFPYEESDPRKLYLDSDNIKKYGVRYGSVYFDSEENEIYPSIEGMTKEQLNLSNINVSLPKDDNGNLDEVLGADNPTDDGLIPDEGKGKIDGQFKIYLKDIGFDLTEKDKDGQYKYQIAGQSVQIAMKSGMCVGREFDVVENGIKKDASLGYTRYVLELKRFEDDQIKGGTAFPNNIYTIDKGDKFVILGIGMPDVYVKSASQKLLVAAQEYLSQNDETKYSYQPTISSNFMARNPHLGESIKEGDIFTFKDDDLQIDASEIIQTLNIEYNLDSSPLPTYKVVLSNDKIASRLDKMQNSINTLVSNGTGITINQVKSLINTIGASMFLRKDISDSTDYLLKFLDGIEIGEYVDSMSMGKGGAIDKQGNAQVESLEVRSYLKVLELIYNRLSATEGDIVFTESGLIEKVEKIDDTTYRLTFRKRWDNDFIAFHTGDILRGIVNNLTSIGEYYTAWSRVLNVDIAANTATVVVYPNEEVPADKNFAPTEKMVVHRWGNAIDKSRQTTWYLSSTEGRIMFLNGVTKPILEEENYAAFWGKPLKLKAFEDKPINYEQPYLYARGALIQDLIRVDYKGNPIIDYKDRGAWEQGKEYTDGRNYPYEGDDVWHLDCRWRCIVESTTQEPSWNATDWVMVSGNEKLSLELYSDGGFVYRPNSQFKANIEAKVFMGNEDITAFIDDSDWKWSRETGNINGDNSWNVNHAGATHQLTITQDDMEDLADYTKFICTAYVRDGKEVNKIEKEIRI